MGTTIEVLPDVTGIDRTFHYSTEGDIAVGATVRVTLNGRRVRGWVVAKDTPAPPGVDVRPIIEVVSVGPPEEVVALCRWGSWRFAGRLRALLVAASPERIVRSLPPAEPASPPGGPEAGTVAEAVAAALFARDAVLRIPPGHERLPVVQAALAASGEAARRALVLVESRDDAARLAGGLAHSGWPVAVHPEQWSAGAVAGPVVVGTRNAVLAPRPPGVTLVLDAHSDAYRSERAPCFDARVVAAERAARLGTPVVFVSPAPSVELLSGEERRLVVLPSSVEAAGWGSISVLDSREEDPREGGYPSLLVGWIREAAREHGRPVVCILNRVGRARLLTCGGCRQVQRCPRCGAAQVQLERAPEGTVAKLSCPRCGDAEEAICPSCGSARLRVARPGVSRAREQLEAVTGLEVGEVSGPRSELPRTPVVIGTQAALHRIRAAALVAWLDFDQELLAPRFRAAEEALGLLARSVRLVGSRGGGGRVVVRTSMPDHEVVRAARAGDPGMVAARELGQRRLLSLPPFSAMARVEGEDAGRLVEGLGPGVEVSRVGDGFVVRAPSAEALAASFAGVASAHPSGWAGLGARVEMEPLDL